MPHDDYAVDSSAETGNGKLLVLKPPAIGNLISILRKRGYQVIAPALTDDAITFQSIEEINDLPIGYTTVQEAGTCRLKN